MLYDRLKNKCGDQRPQKNGTKLKNEMSRDFNQIKMETNNRNLNAKNKDMDMLLPG